MQLENESISAFKSDVILLDGEIPFNENDAPITLESPVSRIVLNGTDSDGTNAGDAILTEEGDVIINETAEVDTGVKDRLLLERGGIVLAESDNHAFPVGFSVNIGERLLLEDDHDEQTIPISDISNISFNEILRENKLVMEQSEDTRDIIEGIRLENEGGRLLLNGTDISSSDDGDRVSLESLTISDRSTFGVADQDNANAVENTGILLENFGQILLDASDNSGTDENSYLAQETTANNRFTLELSGSLIEEEFSSNSVVEKIILESGEDIRMEGNPFDVGFDIVVLDAIRLESGGEFDQLLLDGTNESGADAGDKVALESSEVVRPALLSEATRKITSEGQIPLENRTLNSSAKNTIGLTRSSEILVRTTGDIALEDGTVNDIDGFVGDGMLVLNGTDGSSTNAGDNFDLEGATGITF